MSSKFIFTPNTTQTPNIILDYWMSRLSFLQFKCLLAIVRKTFGWNKTQDKISYSQFCKMVGATKRNVIHAIKFLVNLGLVKKINLSTDFGDADACMFELNLFIPNEEISSQSGVVSPATSEVVSPATSEVVSPATSGVVSPATSGVVSPATPTKDTITKDTITKIVCSEESAVASSVAIENFSSSQKDFIETSKEKTKPCG